MLYDVISIAFKKLGAIDKMAMCLFICLENRTDKTVIDSVIPC